MLKLHYNFIYFYNSMTFITLTIDYVIVRIKIIVNFLHKIRVKLQVYRV